MVALALAQHGVVSFAQLLASGLSRSTVSRYCAVGWLHRIHSGVYSLAPRPLLKPNGLRLAAVLACGPGAALSHQSAAALHSLRRDGGSTHHVTVPTQAGRARPGITVHRSTTLRPADVITIDGIPCTTVARTTLDLADTKPQRELERLLDEAVALERFDLVALEEQIAHATPGRTRAARRLHRALSEHRPGSTQTDGPLGERMLALIRATPGLPAPEVQRWVDLGDGEPMIRPDFCWRKARVIVETDGGIHRRGRRVARDARRDQRAARAGFLTLRVSSDQITGEADRLRATLLEVVTSRSRSIAA